MSFNIEVQGGRSVRLPTAGKYCDRDIIITAKGGPGGEDQSALLDAALSDTLTAIDSEVTNVVAFACYGLSKLETVNLPNAESIGISAFSYCESMTSVNAPKVTSLGTSAFFDCEKLRDVNFPLVTTIAPNCLYGCSALEKVDLVAVSYIGAHGFTLCESLTALILRRADTICTLVDEYALEATPIENGTGYVYVPAALVDSYKAASNWSTFAAQFRAIEDYPEITGG